jgi:hypothetical protein
MRVLWQSLCLFVSSLRICFLALHCIARGGVLHDRSRSSVARDESRMAREESCMARDESCMAGGNRHMTGDYYQPDETIHRCGRTHSHLYSYIYGLVALLDNIQSTFSKYHTFEQLGRWR